MSDAAHTPLPQIDRLLERFRGARIGLVGGGAFSKTLIRFFREQDLSAAKADIVAVADSNPQAPGFLYARELNLFTAADYRELYDLPGLQVIMEITHDPDLAGAIERTKPERLFLIDHFQARYLWDSIQVENIKLLFLDRFGGNQNDPPAMKKLFLESVERFNSIISRRNARSRQIELELVENQRIQAQIIEGSTIPTFVINREHIVTHWNKALEKLSGWPADKVVGTNRQWAPFWNRERPTMADVIVDRIDETEIRKLYGSQWRKSALIEGGYEAEIFFPQVGQNGKWIWFTAAPIKAPDGKIVSAIETLWDKTEDRKVDEERQHHTNELAALCSIYSALSAPWLIEDRIDAALKEIKSFMRADDICLFLRNESGDYLPKRHIDRRASPDAGLCAEEEKGSIRSIAENGEVVIAEEHPKPPVDDSPPSPRRNTASTAFIPIGSKGKKNIGVLRIVGRKPRQFPSGEKHVLELIGNRIGVAIENALLQEQYVKSEEKYRSLFDNDPNPIFIIDQHRLTIVDINERVCVCYGYSREELRNFPFVRLGDSDDPEVETGLAGLRLGRSILFSKKRHYRKAGTPFFVNINASHARYGETDVLIVATTDITEAVEKETQLIQASKMTTLGLMAAGMAHEINQPLNVIQVYADLFLKSLNRGVPLTDEELRTMVKEITANIERATGIIRHVRDFARQSEVLKNRIDINAPVRDVFKVLGNQIKVHQIEMRLNLAPELPPILADHNRLEQVFINLVTNAIDAMDDKAELSEHRGMVKRLDISTFAEADHVVVVVEDNGIGMSEAVKNKIFEPFFTTKKVGRGTGLGVSISYGIVKDYDGTIDIRSRPLQGTRFMIKFPAAPDTRSVSP